MKRTHLITRIKKSPHYGWMAQTYIDGFVIYTHKVDGEVKTYAQKIVYDTCFFKNWTPPVIDDGATRGGMRCILHTHQLTKRKLNREITTAIHAEVLNEVNIAETFICK